MAEQQDKTDCSTDQSLPDLPGISLLPHQTVNSLIREALGSNQLDDTQTVERALIGLHQEERQCIIKSRTIIESLDYQIGASPLEQVTFYCQSIENSVLSLKNARTSLAKVKQIALQKSTNIASLMRRKANIQKALSLMLHRQSIEQRIATAQTIEALCELECELGTEWKERIQSRAMFLLGRNFKFRALVRLEATTVHRMEFLLRIGQEYISSNSNISFNSKEPRSFLDPTKRLIELVSWVELYPNESQNFFESSCIEWWSLQLHDYELTSVEFERCCSIIQAHPKTANKLKHIKASGFQQFEEYLKQQANLGTFIMVEDAIKALSKRDVQLRRYNWLKINEKPILSQLLACQLLVLAARVISPLLPSLKQDYQRYTIWKTSLGLWSLLNSKHPLTKQKYLALAPFIVNQTYFDFGFKLIERFEKPLNQQFQSLWFSLLYDYSLQPNFNHTFAQIPQLCEPLKTRRLVHEQTRKLERKLSLLIDGGISSEADQEEAESLIFRLNFHSTKDEMLDQAVKKLPNSRQLSKILKTIRRTAYAQLK